MKFKHTDTSYYMHICGLEAFLYTIKMKKYARNMIKKSSPKPFKMLKIVLLRGGGGGGFAPLNPYQGVALDPQGPRRPPWPLAKIGAPPPKGAMSGSGPVLSVTSKGMCTNYWLTACSSLPRKKCDQVN